jgi:hypothetical protein
LWVYGGRTRVILTDWDRAMADDASEQGDLAAIRARCEMNYLVASQPKFAHNPLVIAAVASAKASEAAFHAAAAKADAAPWFLMYGAHCHVRETCAALDRDQAALRAALQCAEAAAAAA